MIRRGCAHEDAVRQASVTGRWTPVLQSHADRCRTCGEVRTIAAVLGTARVGPPPRANAQMIWQRARHARRLRAEEVASRIITIGQLVCGIVGLVLLAYWGWRAEFWPTMQSATVAATSTLPWLAGAVLLTAGSMLAMFRWMSRSSS
ncbi:MAG TPA: hypothetical protein VFO19_13860 [Vicinamibacterales bacterium]|nr:hypothetical protein [Vicinamibacterales bacterium]